MEGEKEGARDREVQREKVESVETRYKFTIMFYPKFDR